MMLYRRFSVFLAAVAIIALIAAACGGELTGSAPSPEPSPTPTSEPAHTTSDEPTAAPVGDTEGDADEPAGEVVSADGASLFVSKGCSACHGLDAQGTAIAPALPGHSGPIVKRQARAPVGVMPVFPPEKLTNEELAKIAEFVESLPGGHAHQTPADLGQAIALHHWMALVALEEDAIPEAIHHVEHIIELVEGDHLARMLVILEQLKTGDIHDATHGIEDMLAGTAEPDLTPHRMHLQLALSALRVEDADGAIHHLEHYLGEPSGPDDEEVSNILASVKGGELSEAELQLADLLGIEPDEHDMDMDGHDEGTDAHAHDEETEDHAHDEETEDHAHDEETEDHAHDEETEDHAHDEETEDHGHDEDTN